MLSLKLESFICASLGLILYYFPENFLRYFVNHETDGVHWHMARVAGSVFLGQAFTFWNWSYSSDKAVHTPVTLSRIIVVALWIACTLNDKAEDRFIISNLKYAMVFCIIWCMCHIFALYKNNFPLGDMIYEPKKQRLFNWLVQGDALASILIGCTWIAFPNLILKNQVKFPLNSSHFLVSRCFGALLFATHLFSIHAIYFKSAKDRRYWGLGRAVICCGILGAQIYSQLVYGQWWTRGHWVGASLFSIWTGLVIWAAFQQKLNKFA